LTYNFSPRYVNFVFLAALIACAAVGGYLRLNQVGYQVFSGDEWHLVHRLTYYKFVSNLSSFGNADFGIPLAVLFTPLMNAFGLSETLLRVPMLVAGIASVVVIPLIFRQSFDDRVVVVFAALLAVSPFLISYARIARTYALTSLGVFVAFWFLLRALEGPRLRWRFAIAYAVLAAVVVWTHPITGPVLVAPFAFLLVQVARRQGLMWGQFFSLGVLTASLMSILVLPPLLHDLSALSGKSGIDSVQWNTLVGTAHFWVGSSSKYAVIVGLLLAALGLPRVWRHSEIVRWIIVGSLLTVLALVLMRPWWANMPIAFARYLLPLLPVFLLAVSAGIVVACDFALNRASSMVRALSPLIVCMVAILFWWPTSPHGESLATPNSYTQDSYFQLDYRREKNDVRNDWKTYPVSPFWATLASLQNASQTIAVAPFHYATFDWPAPLWERASTQRVIPAFLWGTCMPTRHGETPPDKRFRFTNATHVIQGKDGMAQRGVDYFVYQINQTPNEINPLLPQCEAWVRERFGKPDFEDKTILVWKLR
jgi:hypothetical protein